jgi:hypothetical protein
MGNGKRGTGLIALARVEDPAPREVKMTTHMTSSLACGIAMLALGSATPLEAQLEIGTWVRQPTASMPSMTMTIEACCGGGRRLTYHVLIDKTETLLIVETRLDGRDAPVIMGGRPSGETMAITRVDLHHASTIVKLNGNPFGTSKATLSADGRTLTVINDFSTNVGGNPVGKYTEVWVKK